MGGTGLSHFLAPISFLVVSMVSADFGKYAQEVPCSSTDDTSDWKRQSDNSHYY